MPIEVSPDLVTRIGRHAHQLNEKSGGQEGGRIAGKLVSDLVEREIQETAQSALEKHTRQAQQHSVKHPLF